MDKNSKKYLKEEQKIKEMSQKLQSVSDSIMFSAIYAYYYRKKFPPCSLLVFALLPLCRLYQGKCSLFVLHLEF